MNSPVLQNILPYITLKRNDSTSIYLQITQAIVNIIQTKVISVGDKLPGARTLSKKLYIHRNTVTAAYEELSAQGWIDIIPQKGAYVSAKKIMNSRPQFANTNINIVTTPYEIIKNYALDTPHSPIHTDLYFTDGTIDTRLIDFKNLNQIFSSITKNKFITKIINKDFYGENNSLRHQLLNYLYITKGILAQSNQLLSIQNYQLAVQCIFQSIFSPNDNVIVIDTGHYEINMKLKLAKVNILTISTNDNGICIGDLTKFINNYQIRALYIQTNHLYPTEKTVTENTKKELLALANEHKFIVIEDDSKSNFIYSKTRSYPLKKYDTLGSVIYLNSFYDTLPHPYDLGYVLAPENLIVELTKSRNILQSQSIYLIEETIAEYIKEGLFLRQLHKLNKIYQRRRDHFSALLDQYFDKSIIYDKPETGLSYWVQFSENIPLLSIANYCKNKNLTIPNYLLYQNQHITAIQLGFAHMNEQEAEEAIAIFSKSIFQHLYS